jgi:hypothetical protein
MKKSTFFLAILIIGLLCANIALTRLAIMQGTEIFSVSSEIWTKITLDRKTLPKP